MHVVIGATGLVGGYIHSSLRRRGLKTVGTSRERSGPFKVLELEDTAALTRFIDESEPEAVYVCAAASNVDGCEREPAATHAVNVEAAAHILDMLRPQGVPVVLFSSDYVFDGAAGPYAEDAVPAPLCEYGRQKLAVERLAAGERNALVLRVTHVFGKEARGKNFGMRCARMLREGAPVTVPADQFATPTHASVIAAAAIDLLGMGVRGIIHVASPDYVSRPGWAAAIARAFGVQNPTINAIPTAQMNQPAKRPLRAGLIAKHAEALLGREFPTLEASLRMLREELGDA
jgi:dTDP-4-dehydrorhamnose reductase